MLLSALVSAFPRENYLKKNIRHKFAVKTELCIFAMSSPKTENNI